MKAKNNYSGSAQIIESIKKNPKLIDGAKAELMTFLFIIENYKGLKIISAQAVSGLRMIENIVNLDMMPRDAMHLAIMDFYNLRHIATNDADFDAINEIVVWKP